MSLVRCPCLQCNTDPALMVTDLPLALTLIRSSLVCEQNLGIVSSGLWTSDWQAFILFTANHDKVTLK